MINLRKTKCLKHISAILCIVLMILTMFPQSFTAKAEDSENGQIMVSLGDSYSSGEGIEPFYGQDTDFSEKVNNPDWLSHRSQNCWPGMLTLPTVNGPMSENRDTNWYFAAMSGAETKHMLNEAHKDYDKQFSKYSGSKVIEPQLNVFDKLGENKADYVTLTLGGNDAGFTSIIQAAAMGCAYLNPNSLADKINNTWKDFYKDGGIRDNLRKAYEDIAAKAGSQAKIIVAGYPQLIAQDNESALFDNLEALIINNAVSDFNKEIENIVNSCKASEIKICFVSVENAFKGHEAYSDDPYINEIMFAQEEDINDNVFSGIKKVIENNSEDDKQNVFSGVKNAISSYSIHPNYYGACAYADCVQKKIDELEADGGQSEWTVRTTSDERDIVLVLDVSGSMAGTPLEETKKAATNFISTILKEDASIGIVAYDSSANMLSDFSVNEASLKSVVNSINDGGGTNIEAGLQMAEGMLSTSNAEKKIIVLMSDGEPNEGKIDDELVAYSDSIKDNDVYIYTLGFFENMEGDISSAQTLMEEIASDGCHYEVEDADNLVFFFGDIADQINGQKYIYVRIACPVDVKVTYDGETLCSVEEDLNTRTKFGSLTFEENETEIDDSSNSSDNRIKVLRLKEGVDYDIKIEGNGRGRMNYTIGFMDDSLEYTDLRKFKNIKINKRTKINTVANNSSSTMLNVDEDGDGKYDLKYKAGINGQGEIVDYTYLIYITIGAVALVAILVIVILIKKRIKRKKKL